MNKDLLTRCKTWSWMLCRVKSAKKAKRMELVRLDLASLNEKNKMYYGLQKIKQKPTLKSFPLRNHRCSTE